MANFFLFSVLQELSFEKATLLSICDLSASKYFRKLMKLFCLRHIFKICQQVDVETERFFLFMT